MPAWLALSRIKVFARTHPVVRDLTIVVSIKLIVLAALQALFFNHAEPSPQRQAEALSHAWLDAAEPADAPGHAARAAAPVVAPLVAPLLAPLSAQLVTPFTTTDRRLSASVSATASDISPKGRP